MRSDADVSASGPTVLRFAQSWPGRGVGTIRSSNTNPPARWIDERGPRPRGSAQRRAVLVILT